MDCRAGFFEVEILNWKTKKQLCFLEKVEPNATITEIRFMFHKLCETVFITGDLQLGLLTTSIILFTLLLLMGKKEINFAVIMFLLCEAGNFSIHVALSDLRRSGSKICKIPYPTKNPFTWLFFFVSCPNYTHEVGTWISLTIMTQCVPVGLFTFLCFIQMTIWANDKHCTRVMYMYVNSRIIQDFECQLFPFCYEKEGLI